MCNPMRLGIAIVLACVAATLAHAQIDTAPPQLMGQPSLHLYSVPSVQAIGGLATFFGCTNTTSAPIRVGVEVFGSPGGPAFNDASATSLEINPGGTVMFGTSFAVGIPVTSSLGAGGIDNASARILATAKKGIICTAFVADNGNAPPITSWQLTIVAKTKQRGD